MRAASVLIFAGLLAAAKTSSFAEDAAKWRADYEASLKAPDGWLSVAGLFWLHEGGNTVGSDPRSEVTLPAESPKRAGVLRLEQHRVAWEPAGGAARKPELKTDAEEHPDAVRIGPVTLTVIERGGKTGVRVRDPNAKTRREFTGCQWFPAEEAWRVKARWVAWPAARKIAITNILGMTDDEPSPGYAEFTVKGKTMRLEPVTEDGQLFFMFKDATSGRTTYGAGRFLYAAMPKGGEVVLDFNQAHNPPCAFTAFATCPLPPRQNALAIAVEAGEKNYRHH